MLIIILPDLCHSRGASFGSESFYGPQSIYTPYVNVLALHYVKMMDENLVSSGLSNDVVDLLDLSQGSLVSTQSLLSQLLSSLLAGVSDQLDQSSLVRSQARHLRNDASDESGSLGESTLSVRDLRSNLLSGDLVTLVQADSNT